MPPYTLNYRKKAANSEPQEGAGNLTFVVGNDETAIRYAVTTYAAETEDSYYVALQNERGQIIWEKGSPKDE